jgi:hypothetical protein
VPVPRQPLTAARNLGQDDGPGSSMMYGPIWTGSSTPLRWAETLMLSPFLNERHRRYQHPRSSIAPSRTLLSVAHCWLPPGRSIMASFRVPRDKQDASPHPYCRPTFCWSRVNCMARRISFAFMPYARMRSGSPPGPVRLILAWPSPNTWTCAGWW